MLFLRLENILNCLKVNKAAEKSHCLSKATRRAKFQPEFPAKTFRTPMLFPRVGKALHCSKANEAAARGVIKSKLPGKR